MKSKDINLESSIEKLESEVRLYHDLDALVKSYQDVGALSDKDIVSVLERIKFQIILDAINRQNHIKDKLDRFTKKWNLFSREERPSQTSLAETIQDAKLETDVIETKASETENDKYRESMKDQFQLQAEKKGTDTFFKKLKRKLKISRCKNCGYFLVNDAEKGNYQCTFFELSSQVDKNDVCENWTDIKQHKKSFS